MPEYQAYRDNLEGLLTFLHNKYGDNRHMFIIGDVREYLGRLYRFVREYFNISRSGITAETLARKLCAWK